MSKEQNGRNLVNFSKDYAGRYGVYFSDRHIGTISYMDAAKQHVFAPVNGVVYGYGVLNEITIFINELNKQR